MYFKLVNKEGVTFNRLIANNPKQAVEIAKFLVPDVDQNFEIVQITHEEFHNIKKL